MQIYCRTYMIFLENTLCIYDQASIFGKLHIVTLVILSSRAKLGIKLICTCSACWKEFAQILLHVISNLCNFYLNYDVNMPCTVRRFVPLFAYSPSGMIVYFKTAANASSFIEMWWSSRVTSSLPLYHFLMTPGTHNHASFLVHNSINHIVLNFLSTVL